MADDYTYPIKKLPQPAIIGDQRYQAEQIAISANQPFASGAMGWPQLPAETPSSGAGGGGGGGGNIPDDCGATGSLGTLNVTEIPLPCTDPRSLISANAIALEDESGNVLELSAVNGRLVITYAGSKTISIDVADLDDGDTASFREFTNCNGDTWKALATDPT